MPNIHFDPPGDWCERLQQLYPLIACAVHLAPDWPRRIAGWLRRRRAAIRATPEDGAVYEYEHVTTITETRRVRLRNRRADD